MWRSLEGFTASDELRASVQRAIDSLAANDTAAVVLDSAPAAVQESLPLVLACSDFIAQSCIRDPELLPHLLSASNDLQRRRSSLDFASRVPSLFAAATAGSAQSLIPEAQMLAQLRRWRRREMVRIAWRDLAGWAGLEETLSDLSAFADAAISAAERYAWLSLAGRYGEPQSATGQVQPLVVIGMGKLGGGELNFSSDVDLVLLFPEHGETNGSRTIANEEFFTRLGQALIRLLDAPTPDGFVLRVDMRLRPFGDSGPLVASFASFEDYLLRHGRDWERYAYVKARPITASERYSTVYAGAVRPFVYRRYLDYGVFESLREMKVLIGREVERRELADHVKLGPGGIREIEFIVQAFQLVRGGRDRRLQTPSLLRALAVLGSMRHLPPEAVEELQRAYIYLRRLENRLQMVGDAQVHQLPGDALTRERIALSMGALHWDDLLRQLNGHRERVSRHFRLVVFGSRGAEPTAVKIDLGRFWDTREETAVLEASLATSGFADSHEVARLLLALRSSALVRKLDEPGRKRLQALLPPLLAEVAAHQTQLGVLRRVLRIIEAIGQRSAYFALLHENRVALARLVELCGHGDFLAQQIAAHPLLLDELIDERLLSELPRRAELARELALRMEQLHDDDPEHQVEALRHFQRAAIFRVAVSDLTGRLPVMQVSDRLTDIAELIVEQAMALAWRQITAQYGTPMCGEGAARRTVNICAVGYGKLGGIELGYASDLDLVFLHDSHGERQETASVQLGAEAPAHAGGMADATARAEAGRAAPDGHRPHAAVIRSIDNQLFFVRLAQRIMHLLTMHSAAGRLYEVDVRLRPSGKGGLLVTSIRAFAEYQRQEAWTWEHQALLHARAVAGADDLRAEFERVRLDTLCNHVRRDSLRTEVRTMRERMRRELSKARPGEFDMKQDPGGIADIEFLAQYWALRWAQEYPPVAMFSDTIRQLESVASACLVPQETVDILTAAYRAYRTRAHHLSLAGQPPIVAATDFGPTRVAVTRIWDETVA